MRVSSGAGRTSQSTRNSYWINIFLRIIYPRNWFLAHCPQYGAHASCSAFSCEKNSRPESGLVIIFQGMGYRTHGPFRYHAALYTFTTFMSSFGLVKMFFRASFFPLIASFIFSKFNAQKYNIVHSSSSKLTPVLFRTFNLNHLRPP